MIMVINLGNGIEIRTMVIKFFDTQKEAMKYIKENNLVLLKKSKQTYFVMPEKTDKNKGV